MLESRKARDVTSQSRKYSQETDMGAWPLRHCDVLRQNFLSNDFPNNGRRIYRYLILLTSPRSPSSFQSILKNKYIIFLDFLLVPVNT